MSETHTTTLAGLKQVAGGIALAVTVSLAASLGALADGELSLKNVTADANKQLVVQFATGQGAPQAPRIVEMPAPNHQLIIDFTGVSLDESAIPSGDLLTKQLAGQMPGVRGAHVGVVANAAGPTVRVSLDLDSDLQIRPTLAALTDGMAVINLGENYGAAASAGGGAAAPAPGAGASASAAANDPAAAYEEYYRKFLQQKQAVEDKSKITEWGPRQGTVEEAKSLKHGVKILDNPDVVAPIKVEDSAPLKGAEPPAVAENPQPQAPAPAQTAEQPAAAQVAEQPAAAQTAEQPAKPEPAQTTEAPATAQPAAAAESAPTPGGQPAQTAEAAAPAKEESAAQAQPDMVPEAEPAARSAPPVTASAEVPSRAPQPGKAAARENESAAAPGDAAAAAAGAAIVGNVTLKEQDKPENQPHVTSPADDAQANAEPPKRRARRLFNEAVKCHTHGQIPQAVAGYKEALKLDSDLGDAHSNLGLAYNQMHNYASALSEFHKALAINPQDAITYNGVGAALRAEHDLAGAIKNWETAVKIDPRLAVAHYNLGTAYEQEGDYDRALVSYEEAVHNDSHLGEAYFRMGLIMHKRHRLQDAKANYKQALKVSADSDYAAEARAKIAAIEKVAK